MMMRKKLHLKNKEQILKILFGVTSCFAFLFILYHLVFANRIIPGVKVGGIYVGGKTADEVGKILADKFSSEKTEVKFTYEDKSFTISKDDVDLTYNLPDTVNKLFRLGRTGNLITDSKDKLAALVKGINLPPSYKYNDGLLKQKISEVEGVINIQSSDPAFVLGPDNTIIVTKVNSGREVEKDKALQHVFDSFNTFKSQEFALPVTNITPKNSEDDLLLVKDQVEKIISNSPVITHEDKKWTFSKEDLLSLLFYKKESGKVHVGINKAALTKLTDDLASVVDVEARGEVFKADGDRVVEFRPKSDGKELDKNKFKKDFSEALLGDNKNIGLTVSNKKAPGDTNAYGIYALLGEGISYFHDSIPGRIHNLTLAAQRSSGVLVAPGDTFSFNKSVGEISYKTGYDTAYIINNGRTVLGEGGGVCQASTTLFRAALKAGLPIVKRTAHAYRVHYYEEKSDVGIDATVFSPSVDFQFKNDTPGYILVQADWDLNKYMLRFKIYGTPDGRTVEMTKPVITSITPPPEPLYQDDPSLRKGVVRQVDFSSWGANVFFKRTVKRGEEVLQDDTFVSRYLPWRAVYLRGTKE